MMRRPEPDLSALVRGAVDSRRAQAGAPWMYVELSAELAQGLYYRGQIAAHSRHGSIIALEGHAGRWEVLAIAYKYALGQSKPTGKATLTVVQVLDVPDAGTEEAG